jgi:5-(carboxyamino)imidazole ribonucleotide synthase
VVGLPLAVPDRHHDAVMRNLIGPEGMAAWPGLQGQACIAPHLYGKAEARLGRKMGHANRLLPLGALAGLGDEAALGPLRAIAEQNL